MAPRFPAVVLCVLCASPGLARRPETPAPATSASASVRPVVVHYLLLGGSLRGHWVNDATMARHMNGRERYRAYLGNKFLGLKTGKPVETDPDFRGHFVWALARDASDDGAVMIGGKGNPMPRPVRALRNDDRKARDIVAQVLRDKGIQRPDVRITRAFSADLDGDGDEELLISANRNTRIEDPWPGRGDYSVALVHRKTRGLWRTVVLEGRFYSRGGKQEPELLHQYTIYGAFDVNGDGRMEVFMNAGYYEGGGTWVYELAQGRFRRVFGAETAK